MIRFGWIYSAILSCEVRIITLEVVPDTDEGRGYGI